MRRSIIVAMVIGTVVGFVGAEYAFATPFCSSCPLSCADLGLGKKDCSYVEGGGDSCCVDLTQRGLDVARAFDRARNQNTTSGGGYNQNERCPAGFQQSEQKCSQEERRRGCKDIRLPNGIGCVRR